MTDVSVAGIDTDDPYEGLKKCKTCGDNKPLDDFYDNHSAADGKFAECKVCVQARRKEKYAERHKVTDVEVAQLNRAEKLVKGFLDVAELTDYEINNQCIEVDEGTGRYIDFNRLENRPGNRWRDKVNKELSNRINKYIKSRSTRAVQVIFEIADSELVEPSDRLKAATWLAERVIGKTPEVLLTGDAGKAYEQIFDTSIESGSREDFRNRVNGGGLTALGEIESGLREQNQRSGDNSASEILDVEVEEDVRPEFKVPEDNLEGEGKVVGYGNNGQESNSVSHDEKLSDELRRDSGGSMDSETGFTVKGQEKSEALLDKERLRKARQKAKQRRFAARALGITSLDRMPYQLEFSLIKTGAMAGKLRCRLVCPSELTETRLAKLAETNALTDEALKLLYPQVEGESEDEFEDESVVGENTESESDSQDDSGTPELDKEIIISENSEGEDENGNE